jgi:hypothetical protein
LEIPTVYESKCSDEIGRIGRISSHLGVSSAGYAGSAAPGYQSQIREGGTFFVLRPLFFTTLIARNVLLDGVWGRGELLTFSFPGIHCCCSWSTVSFIENLIVLPSLHTLSRQCM